MYKMSWWGDVRIFFYCYIRRNRWGFERNFFYNILWGVDIIGMESLSISIGKRMIVFFTEMDGIFF